jgi:hypothetical protein
MLERVLALGPFARQTRRLSPEALKIREVLSAATDPDELIFTALPKALGFKPISLNAPQNTQEADAYVSRLTIALDEISNAGAALRQEVAAIIAQEFRLPIGLADLRSSLTERLRGFANASLEPNLQGFVSRVLNESLPDEDWLDPIIIRLTNKALGDWTDRDTESFPLQVKQIALALDRVSHLYEVRETAPPAASTDARQVKPRQIETRLLTLTTPQGTEERTLIHVPKQSRDAADALVVRVIRQAEEELGPDGARILLAALAERLAATDPDHAPQPKETL